MPETVPPSPEPDSATATGTGGSSAGATPPPEPQESAGTTGRGTQDDLQSGTTPPADSPLDVSGSGAPGQDQPPQSPSGT